jgi:hypothetical protein
MHTEERTDVMKLIVAFRNFFRRRLKRLLPAEVYEYITAQMNTSHLDIFECFVFFKYSFRTSRTKTTRLAHDINRGCSSRCHTCS